MIRQRIRRLFDSRQPLSLAREVNQLRAELDFLGDQLDRLKSSLEMPDTLFDEFRDWRMRTLIPKEPLISVCMATYNRARLLTERSIPSILSQTYRNLELIVVGDGCSDNTAELVGKICDSRLKFVNLPERGCYPDEPMRQWMVAGTQAMNHAMSLARGDYVSHLDDDDEYLPERLEKLLAFALKNQCDLVWHPFWIEEPEGGWRLIDATAFRIRQVTTASVLYRSWFTRIEWNVGAHRLWEPGDWNRFRRIKYLGPLSMRYPEPLLRHYREHVPETIT
jgi:glycosyltransferase involved in cell wall biosynthesis